MPIVSLPDADEPLEVEWSDIDLGEDEKLRDLPKDHPLEARISDAMKSRVSRAERTLKTKLKEDDEFFQAAAQTRGIELREDGKPKGALRDEEIEELRRKASKVDTLTEEVEGLRSEQSETRRTQLHNEVLTSVDGVQEGAKDDLLAAVERQMTYDDEYGWVKTDEDGDIQYAGGEPVGVEGVVEEVRENKPYFFKSQEMNGSPASSPSGGGGGGGKTWTREQYEAASKRTHKMSEDEYRDWESAPDEGRVVE